MKKTSRLSAALAILLITVLAYGQTVLMYFWQDDSALIFKLQNPIPAAGSFGTGIIGEGPYKYLVTPFVPFYPLFGKEPFGYFLVGFLSFLVVVYIFYLFAKQLFADYKRGLIATAVFASGYLGSDIMFRVINSWQTNIGLFFCMLSLYFTVKYARQHKFHLYMLSVLGYWAAVEFVFIRSHAVIAIVVALDIFLIVLPLRVRKIVPFILRQIPFILLFNQKYLSDASFGGPGIVSIVRSLLSGKIEILSPWFANIGNGLIPDGIQSKALGVATSMLSLPGQWSTQSQMFGFGLFGLFCAMSVVLGFYIRAPKRIVALECLVLLVGFLLTNRFINLSLPWLRDVQSILACQIGISAGIFIIFTAFLLRKSAPILSRGLILGYIILSSQILSYFIQYPTSVFATAHRYFSYSTIGAGILWASIWKDSRKSLLFWIPVLVIAVNVVLSISYQHSLLIDRSIPSRAFYNNLQKFVPTVTKGESFYFDTVNSPFYARQFGDFFSVGSMPETTALAMYWNVDRYDVLMFTDFNELLYKLSIGEVDSSKLHTFYYGAQGLIDTSSETRESLYGETKKHALVSGESSDGSFHLPLSSLQISATSPTLLSFEIQGKVIAKPSSYPIGSAKSRRFTNNELQSLVTFIKERNEYYTDATVTSASEWKFREVRNILDNDITTVWQGHRIWWGDHEDESVLVDLGDTKPVSQVIWLNWKNTLSPISYTIETSLDMKGWEKKVNVNNGPERKDGEVIYENFDTTRARYLKFHITKTLTNDSPAILEILALEHSTSLPLGEIDTFTQNPFQYVENATQWDIINSIDDIGLLRVSWKSDKNDTYNNFANRPLILNGKPQKVEVIIPATGTRLETADIKVNIPADLVLKNISITNLSLQELKKRGVIREFKEN